MKTNPCLSTHRAASGPDSVWSCVICVCSASVSFSSHTVITWMRLTARLFPSSALLPSLYLFLSHSKSVISCIITCIIIVPSIPLFQEVCFCLSGISARSHSFCSTHTHISARRRSSRARTPLILPPVRPVVRLGLSLSFVSSLSAAACSNIGKTAAADTVRTRRPV